MQLLHMCGMGMLLRDGGKCNNVMKFLASLDIFDLLTRLKTAKSARGCAILDILTSGQGMKNSQKYERVCNFGHF